MAPRIKRVLLDTDGWGLGEAVQVVDQATGAVIGSGVADGTGAAVIPLQFGISLSGLAAGAATGHGGLGIAGQLGVSEAQGVAGVEGSLKVAQPLAGQAGGAAGAGADASVAGAQAVAGSAAGQAAPSAAVALNEITTPSAGATVSTSVSFSGTSGLAAGVNAELWLE